MRWRHFTVTHRVCKLFEPKVGSLSWISNFRGTRHLNKTVIDDWLGKSLQESMIFNALCMHLDSGQMARSGKRTIVHCPRGSSRRFEALGGIYGCFPSAAYRLNSPTLGKDIYRESNGTKTQRNRSQSLQKPQWRQVNRQRSSGKDFLLTIRSYFQKWRKKRLFLIQILIILPLHNDQRSPGLISHIAWGTCEVIWLPSRAWSAEHN